MVLHFGSHLIAIRIMLRPWECIHPLFLIRRGSPLFVYHPPFLLSNRPSRYDSRNDLLKHIYFQFLFLCLSLNGTVRDLPIHNETLIETLSNANASLSADAPLAATLIPTLPTTIVNPSTSHLQTYNTLIPETLAPLHP